eukprot:5867818-Prymnesium_polylepis.2
MIKHVRTKAKRRSQTVARTGPEVRDLQSELLRSIQSRRESSRREHSGLDSQASLDKLDPLQEVQGGAQESDDDEQAEPPPPVATPQTRTRGKR